MASVDNFDIWLWSVFLITGLIYYWLNKKKLIAPDALFVDRRLLIGIIMFLVIWIYSALFEWPSALISIQSSNKGWDRTLSRQTKIELKVHKNDSNNLEILHIHGYALELWELLTRIIPASFRNSSSFFDDIVMP